MRLASILILFTLNAGATDLKLGAEFINNNQRYHFVTNATTQPPVQSNNQTQGLTAKSSSTIDQPTYELLEHKGAYSIYLIKSNSSNQPLTAKSASVSLNNDDPDTAVVKNERTEKLGVLSGNIIVKLQDLETAKALANDYGLMISLSLASLRTILLSGAADYKTLTIIHHRMQADERIEETELEIIELISQPL